jgi:glycosyltransferase involved in cell wall biosynthesis
MSSGVHLHSDMITIIIPVYNTERYIRKCLSSVCNQSYSELEIILVNDGSTDGSLEIIKEFSLKDNRIKWFDKENGGIGSAYNIAFQHIKGDYILFVDSDDYLELNACENLIHNAIDRDVDMVHFKRRVIDIDGRVVKVQSHFNYTGYASSNKEVISIFLKHLKHPSLINLYKANLFQGVEVFNQNVGIDEMLTPQLLLKVNKALYLEDVYYNVVFVEGSVSRSKYTTRKNLELMKVYSFIIEYLNGKNADLYLHYVKKYGGILYSKSLEALKQNRERNYLKELLKGVRMVIANFGAIKKQNRNKALNRLKYVNFVLSLFVISPLLTKNK